MIEHIQIENYKSIEDLPLGLGRVNVFIGENGAGKSNILEAIALAAAAEGDKLDNEFLASRGVRVSSAALMRSGFRPGRSREPISITAKRKGGPSVRYELLNDNKPYSAWESSATIQGGPVTADEFSPMLQEIFANVDDDMRQDLISNLSEQITRQVALALAAGKIRRRKGENPLKVQLSFNSAARPYAHEGMSQFQDFVIYSPENSSLRTFDREGQIEPLGINGEGLLRFLEVVSADSNKTTIDTIKDSLRLFGWFQDFEIKKRRPDNRLTILDQFIENGASSFDQRSANEGFLFVAFYISLLSTKLTPKFFAIDNIDTALNPKLCQELVKRVVQLAKKNDKQLILTTHNPAILDGLDLNDDEQRLFVISRRPDGQTHARRFKRKPSSSQPTRLSELFIRGALGGLPKSF